MTVWLLLFVSVLALMAFNRAFTKQNWRLVRLEAIANKRTLVPAAENPQLHFIKEHVYFENCAELSGRYSFALAFELQLNLDSIKDQYCTISDRQINWYFKNRLKDVVYILLNYTLQMCDKSSLNYVFVKDVPKK